MESGCKFRNVAERIRKKCFSPVAIKYMHDRHDVQHLVTEARAMWKLKGHPHCVQVYGLFDCPGPHGVGAVMEYMDCKSLADREFAPLKKSI